MSVYLGFCGRSVFVEHALWATPDGLFDLRRENGEIVIWLGRLHIIYTPARWGPRSGGFADAGPNPT